MVTNNQRRGIWDGCRVLAVGSIRQQLHGYKSAMELLCNRAWTDKTTSDINRTYNHKER